MLRALKLAFEKSGYQVVGCAVAGVAAKRLQAGSGIKSDTLRMFLLQQERNPWPAVKHHARQLVRAARKKRTYKMNRAKVTRKTIVVLDEAGQVGTRDYARLAKAVDRAGGTLLCVGDEKQLPSVEAGGGFASIIERFGCARMEKITRQRQSSQRDAVAKLSRGEAEGVLREFARGGHLRVADDRKAAQDRLLGDWSAAGGARDPANHTIFVRTRQDVDSYNRRAQRERADKGELLTSKYVSLPQGDLCVNDRVIFEKKSRALGIENGDMGTVCGVKKTANASYAINLPCDWIIVTSIRETRLYHKGSDQQTYERFDTVRMLQASPGRYGTSRGPAP